MKFSLLLFILYRKLKKASGKNRAFINYIKNKKVRLLIKTADGKRSRLFVFDKGEITSPKTGKESFDVALVWKDAKTGFNKMISDNDAETMIAWKEGKLHVEGNANLLMWFTGATKILMKK